VTGRAVVARAVTWAFWPSNPVIAPPGRHYLNVTTCLLSDSREIAPGTPGAPAWAAMQRACWPPGVMVSYLPGTGAADVPVMLHTLGPAALRRHHHRRHRRARVAARHPLTRAEHGCPAMR
jgi:hypothetical protein